MKKLISLISIVLVLTMLAPCLFACKKNDEPEETPIEYTNIVENGASNYQIVFAETATTAVKTLATTLANEIKGKTGVQLERVTDNTSKYPAKQNEILLSVSKRAETTTALESLTEIGYKLEYVNGKLVIVASNDYLLEKAVRELLDTRFVSENSVLKVDSKLNVFTPVTSGLTALLNEDGKFKYKIIYPGNSSAPEIRTAVSTVQSAVKSLLGCSADQSTDSAKPAEYEILIGETNRQESKDLYASLALMETRSAIVGTKIVIGAGMESQIKLAASNFASALQEAVKGTYDQKYMLRADFNYSRMLYEYLDGVPMLARNKQIGTDDVGDGSTVMVWNNIEANEYAQYVNDIKNAGFTLKAEYPMGSNSHALFGNDATNLYASYIAAEKMVRVFAEKASASNYPTAGQSTYTTIANYVPTMWQLNVDNKNSEANGGMSYVMKLADGSFVIIDGGYATDTEADNLYNHLKANTTDAKPVISAWFITHQHGDHYGALQAFTPKYKDKVVVKGFYFNFPANDFGLTGSFEGTMSSWMKQYTGATIYRKLHTGMTLWFADAKFEIIYTHEDMYPEYKSGTKAANVNDTSTVIKMTFGGKTVMFLGDIELCASRIIERYYVNDKATLKSDFVQFAHHGYEGATKELYDMIEAPTVLWPMNIYGWQTPDPTNVWERWHQNTSTGNQALANRYICYEATYVKTIIVAGEGTTKIELPTYTPRANKLPDYKGIHDHIAATDPRS